MTSDEYINSIISKYKVSEGIGLLTKLLVINPIVEKISSWAGENLGGVYISGSRSKGTAINISSDLDLFISLKKCDHIPLKDIYNSLYEHALDIDKNARKQNVSIGISYGGHEIDLVPARKYSGNTNYHSIYRSKVDSWTQTNIMQHINLVKNCGRREEIIALKVWRKLHGLDFPSIYLELIVIEALKHKSRNETASNFLDLLEYLSNSFIGKKIVDPSNSNNIISDDLNKLEKQAIAKAAKASLDESAWNNVIW